MEDAISVPGPNKRVCAFLIDMLLWSLLTLPFMQVLSKSFMLGWVLTGVYYFLRDSFGRSVGKRIVGLSIVDQQKQQAPLLSLVVRNAPFLLPLTEIIEYFVMRSSKEGRRLGDRLAGTQVVDLRPQVKDTVFLLYSILLMVAYGVFVYLTTAPGMLQ